jgi:hypothetical protein
MSHEDTMGTKIRDPILVVVRESASASRSIDRDHRTILRPPAFVFFVSSWPIFWAAKSARPIRDRFDLKGR